jgi:ribonuclease G
VAKTIVVNVVPEEIRMALLEDGSLAEASVERTEAGHIVGNIYKGRIQNVLPGMQAVFVDIGRDKNAFLFTGDLPANQRPGEADALTSGHEIIVQVAKDAIGTKGPRVTTNLTLPGRYVVLMPTGEFTGVSRRISSEEERARLREIAERVTPPGMGVIVRTVAEGKSEEDLRKDCRYLVDSWNALAARAKRANAPTLLYRDVDLTIRIVRDYFSSDVEKLIVDSREAYVRVKDLLQYVSPELVSRVELYEGQQDIFTNYGIDDELEKANQRRVWLKCGGYIVIDRTEALTVIDVNTGKYTGHTSLADTIFRTNTEAAAEIARQIRLRDVGGIIIIDFIDMDKEEHRLAVLAALGDALKKDRTKTTVLGITGLGLVEMTRKKVRRDLEAMLYSDCPCCEGRGVVKSPETVAINIKRQLRKLCKTNPGSSRLTIQTNAQVAEVFRRNGEIESLRKELARQLQVEVVPAMQGEAYSIIRGRD